MKKNYSFGKKVRRSSLLTAALLTLGMSQAQTSYSFVTAGATGSAGPTQAQVTNAYSATNLSGQVTATNGIQYWTVPSTGSYRMEAWGAAGGSGAGNNGGLGARMRGDFNLTAGTVLKIIVGQQGGSRVGTTANDAGAGGGGSFVADNANTPYIVAGGGGGSGQLNAGMDGTVGLNGTTPPVSGGNGGTNGGGGGGAQTGSSGTQLVPGGNGSSCSYGAGGGGFYTNGGQNCSGASPLVAGTSFTNGGLGGPGDQSRLGVDGGFGGGGGVGHRAPGGGGWSGGGGDGNVNGGGGGGSYNNGTNQSNTSGVRSGDGLVVITSLCNVSLNGATTICFGGSTTLTTTAVSNIQWSTGSTAPSIMVSPQTTTQYTVSGNGSQNCSSIIVFSVIVNPLPVITTTVTPAILCVGSSATIAAGGASTYTWVTGPATNSTLASPVVTTTYAVAGTSSVGCVNSAVYNVDVNTLELTITGNTAVCLGKSTSLTGSGGTSLTWSNFGPFANINPSPTVPTVYTLTGIDANNCLLTQTVNVDVNPNPVVTSAASKTLICKGQAVTLTAGGASSYSWSASAGSAATAVTSVTPALNITYDYSVTGTDANGCTGTSNVSVRVELCTGINELPQSLTDIMVYPNPNNGHFVVTAKAGTVLKITNELGQLVKTISVPASGEISVSGIAKGIYFITGENNGKKIDKKIIVD